MRDASQSRHFSIQWFELSADWLGELEQLAPENLREHWAWLASHHQILTLAKRSEREAGLSILWFKILVATVPIALGAVLPKSRVILVANPSRSLPTQDTDDFFGLREFLEAKVPNLEVMGTANDLEILGFYSRVKSPLKTRVNLRQKAWGKILAEQPSSLPDSRAIRETSSFKMTSRRAVASDREQLKRWARSFVIDSSSTRTHETIEGFDSTEREVLEWLRRGRMVIFEAPAPVGMTALSGDYVCPKLGPIGRLSLVFIDSNCRGRGFGKQMLKDIENELRLEALKGVVLFSDSENEKISNFYSGLGFTAFDDWLSVKTTG